MKIAVLLTCYNRVEKTLSFLESVKGLERPVGCEFLVFLVDDGSSDGTGSLVRERFPDVTVIEGTGSLYWCGGMRLAWKTAVQNARTYDYFLWANDDVVLEPFALHELLSVANDSDCAPVGLVCGAFCDPDDRSFTYGGRDEHRMLLPNGKPQECRYVHGNTVLIPWNTYQKLGIFDERWTHCFGDTDYGLCCIKNGLRCWMTSKYIGTCRQHAVEAPWFSSKMSLKKRWELMWKPVGGDFRQFILFRKKHYPQRWMIDAVKFFVQVLFPRPFELYRRVKTP